MTSSIKEVCNEVLKKINPTESEQKKIHALSKMLTEKVDRVAKEKGVEVEVRIEGSVAKNTWLRDYPEIDIFMQVQTATPRKAFGTSLLEVAKKATEGYAQIERFAEHPYLEAIVDGVYVNIVPCYKVESGKWISATDRTPFHTDYVKSLLNEQKREDVRLLKCFMKGVGIYGAEIKVGGFSGYLCELLILNYGSFIDVLKSAGKWKERTEIDYKGYYKKGEAKKRFTEPVIVIDPVDKRRNVAAAVRKEKLSEFIAASRTFLKNPDIKFFYPSETKILSDTELVNKIKSRGSTITFIKVEGAKVVPDVLWGQLYKSQRLLHKMIVHHDFKVLRESIWSNEKTLNVFVFEIENRFLPKIKQHLGPPLQKRHDCEIFLKKYINADSTVSGPRIEDGRWIVDVNRRYSDVANLLKDKLTNKENIDSITELVSTYVSQAIEILINSEALKLCSAYPEFSKFLTEYLEGKPRWLS